MTYASDIYDLFLVNIRDYKIDKLYQQSETAFESYLQGFLVRAIPDFYNCNQSLAFDESSASFPSSLTSIEQRIISDHMTIQWLNKEINDVSQFENHLTDTDFRIKSEEANLRGKVAHRNQLREIVSQDMTNYGLQNIDWTKWRGGDYGC